MPWREKDIEGYQLYMAAELARIEEPLGCASLALLLLCRYAINHGLRVRIRYRRGAAWASHDHAPGENPASYVRRVLHATDQVDFIENSWPVPTPEVRPGDLLVSAPDAGAGVVHPHLGHVALIEVATLEGDDARLAYLRDAPTPSERERVTGMLSTLRELAGGSARRWDFAAFG